tara:strand:- start:36097 stop:36387 length:291 start_codon:yes stop_codon:yes gene_type:complete
MTPAGRHEKTGDQNAFAFRRTAWSFSSTREDRVNKLSRENRGWWVYKLDGTSGRTVRNNLRLLRPLRGAMRKLATKMLLHFVEPMAALARPDNSGF